ncbi:TPA: LPXTG cell wall anchor domain-containing protein [Streptococcus suis]
MKRSSRKKQLVKWSKLGLSLAAVSVLGGLVEPVGFKVVGSTEVYANEQVDPALEARRAEIKTMIQSYRDLVGQIKALNPADYTEESWNRNYDGDIRIYLGAQSIAAAYNDDLTFSSLSLDGVDSHKTLNELNATYLFGYQFVENAIPILKQAMTDLVPVSKPVETPTDKPVEQPVETPIDKPAETQVVTAKVTAFKLEELVGANYKYQPVGTFSLEPVVIQLQPGETYTPPSYDGYKLVKLENSNSVTDITPEEATISYADFTPGQEISLDYYYLNTKQVYDVVNKRYVDRDTNLSPLPPTEAPTIDNTTDTTNSSVDMAFQEASTRLYNLLMTASRLNPEDYTTESYHKGYESLISPGFTESIVTVLNHYKEVVNGNVKLEDRWDNGASPKGWLTEVYNSDSSVLEQALAGLVAVQQETPSDSGSAGTDEGTTDQTPTDKPAETLVDPSVSKPAVTPLETPAKRPAETPTNVQSSADQVGQSATEPTVLSNQDSQAGTASPTGQSAPGKQETKQEAKEQAAPASPSKQATAKSAPTSQPQAKSLPATGEAHSVLHMTGMGLLGLAGLVVKRRSRKSS